MTVENDKSSADLVLLRKTRDLLALRLKHANKEIAMLEEIRQLEIVQAQLRIDEATAHLQQLHPQIDNKRREVEQNIINDEEGYYTAAVEASSNIDPGSQCSGSVRGEDDDSVSATSYNAITY